MSFADFGLLMVSSTERIKQAASQAAVKALILMTEGSQTQAAKLSAMCSALMSTPYQMFPKISKRFINISFQFEIFKNFTLCVLLSQFVEDIGGIESSVIAQLTRNDF